MVARRLDGPVITRDLFVIIDNDAVSINNFGLGIFGKFFCGGFQRARIEGVIGVEPPQNLASGQTKSLVDRIRLALELPTGCRPN